MFTNIKEKNNKKIAGLGGKARDNIGNAISGNPKLITPFRKPPTDIPRSIIKIVYVSKSTNITKTFIK